MDYATVMAALLTLATTLYLDVADNSGLELPPRSRDWIVLSLLERDALRAAFETPARES